MDGIAKSDPVLLGSGLCAPRSWRRVKIRMWSRFSPTLLPHSPPPRTGQTGVAPCTYHSQWVPSILVPTCLMQQSQLPAGYRVWMEPVPGGEGAGIEDTACI